MNLNAKIYIIDFDDSFVLNIASCLAAVGISHYQVLHHTELKRHNLHNLKEGGVIWGPGPGHPVEYKNIINTIKKLHTEKKSIPIWHMLGPSINVAIFGGSSGL